MKHRNIAKVLFNTAKVYFPDRLSCSTLCRQPFGYAHSKIEVLAVYPPLGSYSIFIRFISVLSLFKISPPVIRKIYPSTCMDRERRFEGVFSQKFQNIFISSPLMQKNQGNYAPFLKISSNFFN